MGFLALPLALMACESTEDIARKPALVDEIVETSLGRCDLQKEFTQTATYETRLEEVLMKAYAESLDFILENNVTVCLDQRLEDARKKGGTWDLPAHALYYTEANVLSLFDNGDDYDHTGTFETTASSYGGKALDRFDYEYDARDLKDLPDLALGRYVGGKTPYFSWDDDGSDYAVIENNPDLWEPPLARNDI